MSKSIDITGSKYGMLTALHPSTTEKYKWVWKCDCGVIKTAGASAIKKGVVISCGCYNRSHCMRQKKHGMWGTREYRAWLGMTKRVSGKEERYSKYFILGMDKSWVGNFEEFYKHIGPAPSKKHSIDRINNSIGYYPGNVRWATSKEQNRNYSQNRIVEYNGERKSITEWAECKNIKRYLIYHRLDAGWSIEDALNTSVRSKVKENIQKSSGIF